MRRPSIVPLGAVVALVAVLASSLVASAATTWGMSRSPSTISQTAPTTVHIEFWNLGGNDGVSDLGCVEIAIPVTFSVGKVTVVGQPAGTSWQASKFGATTVRIKARNGGSRLNPNSPDHVAVDIVVTALVPGLLPWDAHAHSDQQCTKDFSEHITWSFSAGPTPTPTVAPTPTPTPTPVPTPTPAPTPTPKPTPTPTAKPTATPTAVPTAQPTPTPAPTATPTPEPSGTPTASPAPSHTPVPSDTPVPSEPPGSPSPTAPSGTGGGTTTTGGGGVTGGSAGGPAAPGAQIVMPGVDASGPGAAPIAVSGLSALSFGGVEWMVPGLVLTVPGLLIVLVVLLQVVGALAWVPVARRRLGGADDTVRRLPARVVGPR